jgi:uncharacterized membrane protein YphA (DoxX/SURF4 family)
MTKENLTAGKAGKIIYWIATLWLALGMVSTGGVQLFKVEQEVASITKLGYPVYLLTMLGIWKILGVIAILIPRFPLLKEWAYAGFFFAMSGATFSRIAAGDPMSATFPSLLLLVLTIVSWYFRPANRKIPSTSVDTINIRTTNTQAVNS